jgi:hypothetical protein
MDLTAGVGDHTQTIIGWLFFYGFLCLKCPFFFPAGLYGFFNARGLIELGVFYIYHSVLACLQPKAEYTPFFRWRAEAQEGGAVDVLNIKDPSKKIIDILSRVYDKTSLGNRFFKRIILVLITDRRYKYENSFFS